MDLQPPVNEQLTPAPAEPARSAGSAELPKRAGTPAGLRLLMWNEIVRRGDYVIGEDQGYELWEGPSGFRANAFVKAIYRLAKIPGVMAGK